MKATSILLMLTLTLVILSGCGAIFNGSSQLIQVNGSPEGAKFTGSPEIGEYSIPTSINLERKNRYVLTFHKDGYEDAKFTIDKKLSGGIVVLDILFTGLIGVIVDAATGSWYSLSPDAVTVSLTKSESSAIDDIPDHIDIFISTNKSNENGDLIISADSPGVSVKVEEI